MLKWLRKESAPVAKPAVRAAAGQTPRAAARGFDDRAAMPLPEVLAEGNSQADWSAWEDSVAMLDSRFPELDPGSRVQLRDSRFGPAPDLDPFAGVGHRRDL